MTTAAESSELLDAFTAGDRRALARVLSLVESGEQELPHRPTPTASKPITVGITGSGGAGKSTLIGALVQHLRADGKKVAVLACDPQSPKTGGALLGDRIRVRIDPADEGVYFRSVSTRGAPGGISACTAEAVDWLAAFGFDVVLVETVGIGQDQVAVADVVDTLVLIVTPAAGDEVQWEKAGVIELADLVVVNKADMPGADRVQAALVHALSLATHSIATEASDSPIPVLSTTATTGAGVAELWQAIMALRTEGSIERSG